MTGPWILVTGNGAFGATAERTELRYDDNPSARVAQELDGEVIDGHRLVGRVLRWDEHPREALEPLLDQLAPTPPAAVLSLGVFSGRTTISVERVALNVRDFQFADEGGRRPAGEPVSPDGPPAYFATIPVKAVTAAIRSAGVPALVSNTASTHGCNSVMYTALHLLRDRQVRAGFIHIPDSPEHIAALGSSGPSMDGRLVAHGIRAAIGAVIAHPENDIVQPANEWEW